VGDNDGLALVLGEALGFDDREALGNNVGKKAVGKKVVEKKVGDSVGGRFVGE
jgi:hypothetical protein